AEDRGDTHLYELSIDGGAPKAITDGRLVVTDYHAAGGTLATTQATVQHSGELWVDRGTGFVRATNVTVDRLGWEKFAVPCTDGSDEIDAWIMRPPGFGEARRIRVCSTAT